MNSYGCETVGMVDDLLLDVVSDNTDTASTEVRKH